VEEAPKSKLYVFEPLVRKLPEVSVPKRHVPFKEKFIWSALTLVVYLIMAQIPLYGMAAEAQNWWGSFQYILASRSGTLMQLGIGPIVTAGIIMQLLVGARIINLDLTQSRDRALFTGVQKMLAIFIGVIQAAAYTLGGAFGSPISLQAILLLIAQLTLGVIIVIYLDELVSKYGFGSGISLFIAGGVASAVFWQAFNPLESGAFPGELGGAIPKFFVDGVFYRPWPEPSMVGVLATLAIFFIVIYAENVRVEVPLAYSRFGGIRGRYPIRFFYASVIPVILASVLFANFRLIGRIFGGSFQEFINTYLNSPNGLTQVAADPIRAVVYLVILVGASMGFAWMWINMTNMGPRDVAQQLHRSGMSIPGFRRDIRIMERVLSRYITAVTLLGGAAVGALSAGADFLGALGSGTGILLTVSIVYRLYQEMAREQISEMFPMARRFLGE